MSESGNNDSTKIGKHAIVIGASVAGMLAARVLSDLFDKVTLLDRDALPAGAKMRKGIPQSQHAHAILAKGMQTMGELFPGLMEELEHGGGVVMDFASELRWFHYGDYKGAYKGTVHSMGESRPLLDATIRSRLSAIPNVVIMQNTAINGLTTTEDHSRITGILVQADKPGGQDTHMEADLVVDAGGRGSRSPQWLEGLGYDKPTESEVRINVGYTSRFYLRRSGDISDGFKAVYVSPAAPHEKRGGIAIPTEGDRWLVTLFGYFNDHAPTDDKGFTDYARSLAAPDVFNLISHAEPVTEASTHKVPSSLRRHYEKMDRFPEGYIVMGDAVCSFNPIFGQGMTVASREAIALKNALRYRGLTAGMSRAFYREATATIDLAWMLATGEDFRYTETVGNKPFYTDLLNKYTLAVHHATAHDTKVYGAFIDVMNMLKPPTSLFAPVIIWRVWRANNTARQNKRPLPMQPSTAVGSAR